MRILSLNLHCYAETDVANKQQLIVNAIIKYKIDVILLQEVAQTEINDLLFDDIKKDNYGYLLQELLKNKGYHYDYYYQSGNRSFGSYDEGLAILSNSKLNNQCKFYISKKVDYDDWSTRLIVSAEVNIDGKTVVFTSAHLGWSDGYEVFEDQVDLLFENLDSNKINVIGGDFNVSSNSKEYQYLMSKGYKDIYYNNEKEHFSTPTHMSNMDVKIGTSRIDYIFTNTNFTLKERKLLFTDATVSDHFGVMVEIEFL